MGGHFFPYAHICISGETGLCWINNNSSVDVNAIK